MNTNFLEKFELIKFSDLLLEGDDIVRPLDSLALPGFYGIHCFATNRTYITHAENVADLIQYDYTELYYDRFQGSPHLVSDVKKYGLDSLAFVIIKVGPNWRDLNDRKKECQNIKKSWPSKY